jgi:hypothetical protein
MGPLARAISRQAPRLALAFLPAILTFGCGDSSGVGTTYPVSGEVTLDGNTLTVKNGTVVFYPDAAKGNTSTFEPTGAIDKNGRYTLNTKGKKGAPPGWYKVVVTGVAGSPQHARDPHQGRPVARSGVPTRYGQAKTSDLSVEVVEKAGEGAYDLKLKSN